MRQSLQLSVATTVLLWTTACFRAGPTAPCDNSGEAGPQCGPGQICVDYEICRNVCLSSSNCLLSEACIDGHCAPYSQTCADDPTVCHPDFECDGQLCVRATCGDGKVAGQEVCDDGSSNSDLLEPAVHCNATCTGYIPPRCNNTACPEGSRCASDGHCRQSCTKKTDCPFAIQACGNEGLCRVLDTHRCKDDQDCLAFNQPPTCTEPATCQGQRFEYECGPTGMCARLAIDDDSGCLDTTLANECGNYRSAYCNGALEQEAPVCLSSCSSSSDAGKPDRKLCDEGTVCTFTGAVFECRIPVGAGECCGDPDLCPLARCGAGLTCGDTHGVYRCCQDQSRCCLEDIHCQDDQEGMACNTETLSCFNECRSDDNRECKEGFHCFSDDNRCYNDRNGSPCDADSECSSGRCDSRNRTCANKLGDRSACTKPSDCNSGSCSNGICCSVNKVCCTSDAVCPGEYACNESTLECADDCANDDDAACKTDAHCFSSEAPNTCQSGADGSRCDTDAECISGRCISTTKVCTPKLTHGNACSRQADCESNYCSNRICCDPGQVCCASDWNCPGTYTCNMSTSVCRTHCNDDNDALCTYLGHCFRGATPNTCENNFNGARCDNDFECRSGYCGLDNRCANPPCNFSFRDYHAPVEVNAFGTTLRIWADSEERRLTNGDAYCGQRGNHDMGGWLMACGDDELGFLDWDPRSGNWVARRSGSANRCYSLFGRITCRYCP